ncbi:ubiquinone biosynthesis O-methyltransferase [Anaplasma platys]|uniref:Ubiquinone biosynthesis O-methyltransferase n=1 Tax=Anaplasma platys TaxID=949 RepID=A0A858PX62_9RICK|nr:methyltransferase [Anaplasma platys]QJC27170.1 ubiquinone biosynthesis O-methyltransferase [Anaplasma platys]
MRKVFACFSDGIGSLLSRIAGAVPSISEVVKLLRSGHGSLREGVLSIREKSRCLLETNIDLGLFHFYRGNVADAKTRFWLIRLVRPDLPEAHYNIGRCNLVQQRHEKALANFERALALDPNHKEARYYLNKITAPDIITAVPENVIKQHFNYTSEYFVEHWLIANNYRGHEHVRALVMNFFGDRLGDLLILDIGCGTGICGQFLRMRDIGYHIAGVDISRRMLDIARQCFVNGKRAYNELICVGAREFLKSNTQDYDVIVMTEFLHYYGDLKEILGQTSKALKPTGMLIGLLREGRNQGYRFVKDGDFFCHSVNYLNATISELGLRMCYINRCYIYGEKVEGLLFAVARETSI